MSAGLAADEPNVRAPYHRSPAPMAGSSQRMVRSKGVSAGTLAGPSTVMLSASSVDTTAMANSSASGWLEEPCQLCTRIHQAPASGEAMSQRSSQDDVVLSQTRLASLGVVPLPMNRSRSGASEAMISATRRGAPAGTVTTRYNAPSEPSNGLSFVGSSISDSFTSVAGTRPCTWADNAVMSPAWRSVKRCEPASRRVSIRKTEGRMPAVGLTVTGIWRAWSRALSGVRMTWPAYQAPAVRLDTVAVNTTVWESPAPIANVCGLATMGTSPAEVTVQFKVWSVGLRNVRSHEHSFRQVPLARLAMLRAAGSPSDAGLAAR